MMQVAMQRLKVNLSADREYSYPRDPKNRQVVCRHLPPQFDKFVKVVKYRKS
mgnify:FL=1